MEIAYEDIGLVASSALLYALQKMDLEPLEENLIMRTEPMYFDKN